MAFACAHDIRRLPPEVIWIMRSSFAGIGPVSAARSLNNMLPNAPEFDPPRH
jgi:hypothetical protein